MLSEKKRVTVMLVDRITPRVIDVAEAIGITPNEFVNRCVEGCLHQIDDRKKPLDAPPIVEVARLVLRSNLSFADRILQKQLEERIEGWAKKTQDWRDLVVRELNFSGGVELTTEAIRAAKKAADKILRDIKNGKTVPLPPREKRNSTNL